MSNLREIVKYGVRWNLDKSFAIIRLVDNKDNCYEFEIKKSRDVHMILHLLQTEKPIFFNVEDHYLSTAIETIGEESSKVMKIKLKDDGKSDDDES